jgi:hypothetical protein
MGASMDALKGCTALALALAVSGCSSTTSRNPRVEGQDQLQPVARAKSTAPLGIAAPPAPQSTKTDDVLLASAAPPSSTPSTDPPLPLTPAGKQADSPSSASLPGTAVGDPPPAESLKDLRRLFKLATAQYGKMDSYIVRLRRREQVGTKKPADEILCLRFRKEPWSVSMKWIGTEGKGREVLYVKDKYENKIHTLLAAGDMPFAPAGKKIALAVDSALVKSASRHSITEAGIGALIEHLGSALENAAHDDAKRGSLTYLGEQTRPEFSTPREAVEEIIVAGADPSLPRGGRRLWYFDPDNHLPVLVLTYDDAKREVEYYLYDKFQFGVKLDEDDFDPDKMGGKP